MTDGGDPREFTAEDLTVNICTVDRAEMLEACLASLLRTTPDGVSLQIVFNGSPQQMRDRIKGQAEDWNGPTTFIDIDDTVSVDESHNRALAGVTTPLVNFMGDDDVVLGERISTILDAFNTLSPTPSVVTTFARRIAGDASEPALGSAKELGPTSIEEWKRWHESGEPFEMLWPGAVLQTERLRSIGGFEPPFSLSFDNRIFSQLSFLGPVLSLPDQNFGFRIHQGSMSTSKWKDQNRIVRFVRACHEANLAGAPEPSFEAFCASEDADSAVVKAKRDLRDRSRVHFRKGGALALSGEKGKGAGHMFVSAFLWPPAFIDKIADQIGRGRRPV